MKTGGGLRCTAPIATVSDLSHEEAGWRLVDFGDDIPCEAALVGARQVSTPTSQRLEREAAERLGLIAT